MRAAEAAAARANQHDELDVEDLLDDPELERLHRDRLLELQREAEKRAIMQQRGHGECVVRQTTNTQQSAAVSSRGTQRVGISEASCRFETQSSC